MSLELADAIKLTPLNGTKEAENIEDIALQLDVLSSSDACDVEANHIVADALLLKALGYCATKTTKDHIHAVIAAYTRIHKLYT